MKTNIGLAGYGIVGKAFEKVFLKKVNFFIYDKYLPEYNDLKKVTENCELIFVAVPTPMNGGGSINLTYVKDVLKSIQENLSKGEEKLIILRSTMVPGTTESLQKDFPNLKLVFNPEFLSERNYESDMKKTNRIVLGGNLEDCKKVKQIYLKVFPKVKYVLTDTKTAEMIKYSANITLAGQVIIANELYMISKKLGIDWKTVRDTIVMDPLIGKNNNVPGPDGSLGFGGKCLPKDINALIHLSKSSGYSPEFLEKIWETNLKLRKDRNWRQIKGATSKNGFKSI